ncbi:MAG: hypothetical protein PHS24_01080 [Bacilli bacterium]|nr:hypothetical protein [Bacilli bacterium]
MGDYYTERDTEFENLVGLTLTMGEYSNEIESLSINYTYIKNLSIDVKNYNIF